MSEIQKLVAELLRAYAHTDHCRVEAKEEAERAEVAAERELADTCVIFGANWRHTLFITAAAAAANEEIEEIAEAEADREALRRSRAPLKRFRLGHKRNGGRKPRRAY
jgi:hypothetical protein